MASIDLTDNAPMDTGVHTLQLRALAARELPIKLRGYDPEAVDALRDDLFRFCAGVESQLDALLERSQATAVKEADEISVLARRVADLERALGEAVASRDELAERLRAAEAAADEAAAESELDDPVPVVDVYTNAGDEVATVLRAARSAADDLLRTASELAEETQRDAEEVAERCRTEAEERLESARRTADELLGDAHRDAAEMVGTARRDAYDIVERARQQAEADTAAAEAHVAALQETERQLRTGLQTAGQWLLRAATGELEAAADDAPFTTAD